ncbi:hypothetical protein H632_c2280p1 [Helicosporidium sp. ATCC 50920]|nr:hypothetical protein H632_c2280p1 [Helicosporidium sp. ATCC 50920]|eukprot:KDD73337.1 hypothetical protein H632_c2280p1 [Helicosporidium sp. ATCC 50920]
MFLPFFPLERQHIRELFELKLRQRSKELDEAGIGRLAWDDVVVTDLLQRVEFEGPYPIEGGKEVGMVLTKHVSRPSLAQLAGGGGGTVVNEVCHLTVQCGETGITFITCEP